MKALCHLTKCHYNTLLINLKLVGNQIQLLMLFVGQLLLQKCGMILNFCFRLLS